MVTLFFFISVSNADGTLGPIHVEQAATIELHCQAELIELMVVYKNGAMGKKEEGKHGSGSCAGLRP